MYKHRQIGWFWSILILIFFIIALIVNILMAAPSGEDTELIYIITTVVMAALLLLFNSITVVVDDKTVLIKMGIGLVKRRILLSDIESCEAVRNKWWYGWGVRYTPAGWMFNIHGLDAVQLYMKGNKKFRVGTDEPDILVDTINKNR